MVAGKTATRGDLGLRACQMRVHLVYPSVRLLDGHERQSWRLVRELGGGISRLLMIILGGRCRGW